MTDPVPRHFSAYLDLVRFSAAAGVLLFHIRAHRIGPDRLLSFFPQVGHEFVIVFFVLSGYVIAATVDRKRGTLETYALDRMARVYSVVVPTLFTSIVAGLAMGVGSPSDALQSLAANLSFVGQSWSLGIIPPANPAFWSLSYEVMYYALFGCLVFLRGPARVVACVSIAALAGPKVMVLLPCWMLGVAAYRWRDIKPLSRRTAMVMGIAIPAAAFAAMSAWKIGAKANALFEIPESWGPSSTFAKDYITSVLIALHLYCMRWLEFDWNESARHLVVKAAAFTFTLYLIHYPVLLAVAQSDEHRSPLALAIALVLVFGATLSLGTVTEGRRHELRTWLAATVDRVASRRSPSQH
jgi:peptidoglycan/LPS O-acetylase OafA/YrhL